MNLDISQNGYESGYQSPEEDFTQISKTTNTAVDKILADCKENNKNVIDLSRQGLQSVPQQLLELYQLQYIYLEGNEISYLPEDFFDCFLELKWLDLRNNQLQCIPSFFLSSIKCLEMLLLEGNQLESLPLELGLVTTLQGLNLRNNPLKFPPPEIISKGVKQILSFLRQMIQAKTEEVSSNDTNELNYIESEYSDSEGGGDNLQVDKLGRNKVIKSQSIDSDSSGALQNPIEKIKPKKKKNQSVNANNSCSKILPKTQSDKYINDNYGQPLQESKIQEKFVEEQQIARRKKALMKQDAIIQGRKDKESTKEWKDEYKKLQAMKLAERRRNGKIDFEDPVTRAPFAVADEDLNILTNDERLAIDSSKKKMKPRPLSPESIRALERAKRSHERDLKAKVQEHMKILQERKGETPANPQHAIQAAKHDLDIAMKLQEEIQQRRKELEYRMTSHIVGSKTSSKKKYNS